MRTKVLMAAVAATLLTGAAQAQISDGVVKLGVTNDQASTY